MATVSLASPLPDHDVELDPAARAMMLIDDGYRAGSGLAGLEGGRGDEFGFDALAQVVRPIHPECVAPLHAMLDSKRLLRSSAEVTKCLMVRVCQFVIAQGPDPFACTADDVLDLLSAYRDNGRDGGGPMSSGSCNNFRRTLVAFHLANGRPDPCLSDGPVGKAAIDDLLAAFAKEDEAVTGGRPGVAGVSHQEMPPAIGYHTDTPVNMGHLARFNARIGGRLNRLHLREQTRALVIRETHVDTHRLAFMRPEHAELGAEPGLWIERRADGTGGLDRFKISRPLARMVRLLIDDVTGCQHGPPWPDAIVFQGVAGSGGRAWTGTPAITNTRIGLRTTLLAAADQARARGENGIGSADEVARFVERLTYESIRDGLLWDCHASHVPKVALALFLNKQRIVEIDNFYRRQDRRTGSNSEC